MIAAGGTTRVRQILVLESNPGVLIVARNGLVREGHKVLTAASANEALVHMQDDAPDLALVDVEVLDPELVHALADARGAPIPLVLLVHKGEEGLPFVRMIRGEATSRFSVVTTLEKPFSAERLVSTVRALAEAPVITSERPRIVSEARERAPSSPWAREADTSVPEDSDSEDSVHEGSELIDLELDDDASAEDRIPTNCDAANIAEQGLEFDDLEQVSPWMANVIPLDAGSAEVAFTDPGRELQLQGATDLVTADDLLVEPPLPIASPLSLPVVLPELEVHLEDDRHEDDSPALEGRLGLVSVDALLQLAARAESPVICTFERPDTTIDVLLQHGHVAWARRTSSAPASRRPSLRESSKKLLQRTTEELIFEILAWKNGRFTLRAAEAVLPEDLAEVDLALHLDHLLIDGLRRLDEHRRSEA